MPTSAGTTSPKFSDMTAPATRGMSGVEYELAARATPIKSFSRHAYFSANGSTLVRSMRRMSPLYAASIWYWIS